MLCQNCVTYPPETLVKSGSYGNALTRIDVAEVVDSELRWWDLVCVSTRGRSRFPSVRLQPLGHLSVFRINNFQARPDREHGDCNKSFNMPAPLRACPV